MVEFVFPVADPEPLPLWQVGNEGNHWHSFDIISADPDQNHAASYSVVCVHLCVEEKSGLNSRNMETCMHTLAASPLRPWPWLNLDILVEASTLFHIMSVIVQTFYTSSYAK